MNDRKILALYRQRDPRALSESRFAYGEECRQIALNILDNAEEADAVCLEVLEKAVEELAETGPCNVRVYLLRATHRRALEIYWQGEKAHGRERHFSTVTEELSECATAMEEPITLAGFRKANKAFVGFFRKLGAEGRDMFICRYFWGDTLGEISRRFGVSEDKVAATLYRARKRLRKVANETELYMDDVKGMTYYMESIPSSMLVAAHGEGKRFRKLIPWGIGIAAVVVVVLCYPYLREAINVDLSLRSPDWQDPQLEATGEEEDQKKPLPPRYPTALNTPVKLGKTTLTATDVTDTTVTLTVVKEDDTPIYGMIYDGIKNALASTEKDYKVNGHVIKPYSLKLSVDGGETVYAFPTAPGTYEIVVSFASLRNSETYEMLDLLGVYAYIGEEGVPVTVSFDLTLPEEDTTAADTDEGAADPGTEAVTADPDTGTATP